jgi:hypothetical protein
MNRKTTELVAAAFDYAVASPEGFTLDELAEALDVQLHTAKNVIQKLRDFFGEDDTINLVANPAGQGDRWRYFLTGTLEEASPWLRNRMRDMARRMRTETSVLSSFVAGLDGRSTDGKHARLMLKTFTRMIEDLAEIDA